MEIFETFNFSVADIIDIILVATLLYYFYKLVKGTVAINIFIGIVIIYLVFKVTQALQMTLFSSILGGFINVGMFALIVVFQQEIRKFLLMVGSSNIGGRKKFFKQLKFLKNEGFAETNVDAVIDACIKMGSSKTGALIVIERNNNLDIIAKSGDAMNIAVTQPIIESIFFKNSPLHDGAVVISSDIIKATRVILPVSNEQNIPQRFGLRHRAAIGITERTDAVALVVSEETGQISYIKNGQFVMFENTEELKNIIKKDLI
ncbi:MAG: diadenylate cyclase CdaA [Bacteroidia bacterium]|nr:diadenylate cyclase CdaA [Bacteroidia bacterium]MBT8279754.1 diadenylate cyclase CdaA [Bacteroidia bacterium]NNK59248.1 TIGR00159 family protein [Flavobacteriaceae bacterium]NNL32926.1 TIGR00159 family protein [Flavobacteriaceae bacterium]